MAAQPLTAIVQSRLVQRAILVQRPGIFQRPSMRGVDLGLDKFDLSEAGRTEGNEEGWGTDLQSLDACAAIGGAFWRGLLDGSSSAFQAEDKALLQDVFNPHLSDRREEGDAFVPPDKSPARLRALREILQEEAVVRRNRIKHFLSTDFVMSEPGVLFPESWKSTIGIARKEKTRGLLHPRPDYKAEAHMFDEVLRSGVPTFDRSTEDGMRFRIYCFGSLEVRTTQEHNAKEVIGAVFSLRAMPQGDETAQVHEELVKATEYVEGAGDSRCRYYVVFETSGGHAILTEKLSDSTVAWEENASEDRNSIAKVLRSCDLRGAGISVEDMQAYRACSAHRRTSSKRYADSAYMHAVAGGGNN